MFKITHGDSISLDDLAKRHYDNIVNAKPGYKGKGMPYELASIIRRIVRVQKKCTGRQLNYINDLCEHNYALVKRLLIGKPEELQRLAKAYTKGVKNGKYPKILYRKKTTDAEEFGDKLEHIFNYSQFVNQKSDWNCYELTKLLGVNVCIYCNRNYTYTVAKGRDYHVRPEFDHFLPKSKFPFLAISFYNLIPSCHTCNSNLKNDTDFNISQYVHPYMYSMNDLLKFTVEFQKKAKYTADQIKKTFGVMFFMNRVDNFEIKLKRASSAVTNGLYDKARRNVSVFKLEDLYNCHKDLVTEMIMNAIIYSDTKIDELLNDYRGVLFNSREDVLRHISKNYPNPDDQPKRPFSKLTRDIQTEFGLNY